MDSGKANGVSCGGAPARLRRLCRGGRGTVALFLALFIFYNLTLKINFSNDCTPNIYLPFAMLKHGSINMNHFPNFYAQGLNYFLYPYNGSYYSAYGIGAPLMAVPFFAPLAFGESIPSFLTLMYAGKAIASLYVALSAVFLYAALRRMTRRGRALAITLLYAAMTPVFCTASQMLWQHSCSVFLSSLAIYFLVRGEEEARFTGLSGLPLGVAVLVRPNDLVAILPVFVYVALHKRSQLKFFLFWLFPGLAATAAYNYASSGSPFTFPIMARAKYFPDEYRYLIWERAGSWRTPFLTGFFGNLVSPSRGIFAASPVLAGTFLGLPACFKRKPGEENGYAHLFRCFAAVFVLHLLMVSKWTSWSGGESFGNRLMIDALPFLVVLFVPAADFWGAMRRADVRKTLLAIFVILALFSFFFQAVGIVSYDGASWGILKEESQEACWSLADSQLVYYLRNANPVVPTVVKRITHEPPRLSGLELRLSPEPPRLVFRLSEVASVEWNVIDPEGGEKVSILRNTFVKGENILLITDDDERYLAEKIGYQGDVSQLMEHLVSRFENEFVVSDILIPLQKSYFLGR